MYSNDFCELEWNNLLLNEAYSNNLPKKIDFWLDFESKCNDSDFYYLKLGWLFIEAGDFNKANKAFVSGSKITGAYQVDIELGLIDLTFQRATRGLNLDLALVNKSKREMELFIKDNLNRSDAYALMSGIQLVLKEYQTSIKYAEKAIEFGHIPVAYRNMAISYGQLGKAGETVEFAGKAVGLSPSLEGDRDLMLAASMGYYELGNIELAYGTMRLLIDANPSLIKDPLVKKIGYALQKKFNEINQ